MAQVHESSPQQETGFGHQPLLNDILAETPSGREFKYFPELPLDIRLIVWRRILRAYDRIITITIVDDGSCLDSSLKYSRKNALGNIVSGGDYVAMVATTHQPSVLLRTSQEARQAALKVFRVRMPCYYKTAIATRLSCVYLSPDLDILHLKVHDAKINFADFLHDVKAHDPQGVGVSRLAIGSSSLAVGDDHGSMLGTIRCVLPSDPAQLSPLALSSFKATIENLRQVSFVQTVPVEGRTMFCNAFEMSQVHFNRSFPIQSFTEKFVLHEPDPRQIDADLERVYVGHNPHILQFLWRDMVTKFQFVRSPNTKFEYILQARIQNGTSEIRVCSRADAVNALRVEDEQRWTPQFDVEGMYYKFGRHANPDTPESLAKAPMPAVGFWSVPAEAFGELPGVSREKELRPWSAKGHLVDMRQYRPRLGLFQLLD